MKIDWFTVIAQLVNFLILIWLLRRFLYKPVLDAVAAREGLIASRVAEAETVKEQAKKSLEQLNKEKSILEATRDQKLSDLQSEISQKRGEQLESIQAEAKKMRKAFETSMEEQKQEFVTSVKQNIRTEIIDTANQMLSDLGSATLNDQIVQKFVTKIAELSQSQDTAFLDALKDPSTTVKIESAFDITSKLQTDIAQSLATVSGTTKKIEFATKQELVAGIELSVGNYILSWNINDYLNGLDHQTSELFKSGT